MSVPEMEADHRERHDIVLDDLWTLHLNRRAAKGGESLLERGR